MAPSQHFNLQKVYLVSETLQWCSLLPFYGFGIRNKRWNADFRLTFQWFVAQIEYSTHWKGPRKCVFHPLFILPNYLWLRYQANILEDWTKGHVCVFKVLFKGVSTRFGDESLQNEKKMHTWSLFSLPKSLSKSMLPKRRFWNVEKYSGQTFCKHFSYSNYCIWAKRDEKFSQNISPTYFPTFHNLRLGGIKSQSTEIQGNMQLRNLRRGIGNQPGIQVVLNLYLPTEDFGMVNKRWNAVFRIAFQWLVAQI